MTPTALATEFIQYRWSEEYAPPHRGELVSLGNDAVAPILEAVTTAGSSTETDHAMWNRAELCAVLAQIGTPDSVRALGAVVTADVARANYCWVRHAAAAALRDLAGEGPREVLRQALAVRPEVAEHMASVTEHTALGAPAAGRPAVQPRVFMPGDPGWHSDVHVYRCGSCLQKDPAGYYAFDMEGVAFCRAHADSGLRNLAISRMFHGSIRECPQCRFRWVEAAPPECPICRTALLWRTVGPPVPPPPVPDSGAAPERVSGSVQLVEEQEREGNRYMVYRASSRPYALQWLREQVVDRERFYLVVETDEGSVGKDVAVIFDEQTQRVLELGTRARLLVPRWSDVRCSLCAYPVLPLGHIPHARDDGRQEFVVLEEMRTEGAGFRCAGCGGVCCAVCADPEARCSLCDGSLQPYRGVVQREEGSDGG